MSTLSGARYVRSGKFDITRTVIAVLVAAFIAIGIGRLYAIISVINPIIYLNFLVLFGAVFLLAAVVGLVKIMGKSRNIYVDFFSCAFICWIAWSSHWAHIEQEATSKSFWESLFSPLSQISFVSGFASHRDMSIGRLGSSGIALGSGFLMICYMIEFVAFMAPIYFSVTAKEYYCEDCDADYTSVSGYLSSDELLHKHVVEMESGNFRFLNDSRIYKSLDHLALDPQDKPSIALINLNYCKKCNANAIANVSSGVLKQDDKKKRQMSDTTSMLENTYIADDSSKLILARMDS